MLRKLQLPFSKELREGWTEVYVHPEWGSGHHGHREKIRTALDHQLSAMWSKDVSYSEFLDLKDLEKIPSFKKIHVSISHGQGLGGFAISHKPIGFDLELRDRVLDKIVRRIATEDEVAAAPSLAQLWAAKEAAYKALRGFQQPPVISDLVVGDWNSFNFRLINEQQFLFRNGRGISWIEDRYVFALFTS